jgi:hypothetical protein
MAYRNKPHGTSKYSPYYLLHGREMVPPLPEDLRAKLSPEIRNSEHAPRLQNLKNSLKMAYKIGARARPKAHAVYKRYYARRAKQRSFEAGDWIHVQLCHQSRSIIKI